MTLLSLVATFSTAALAAPAQVRDFLNFIGITDVKIVYAETRQ